MDDADLADCLAALAHQDGVVSARQLRERAPVDRPFTVADRQRWERRRLLARVHPGVWVDHTGPLTDRQTLWAAVLAVWPAALYLESARDPTHRPVHVAVEHGRRLSAPAGVRLHRVRGLAAVTRSTASPPRVVVEANTLALVARARDETQVVRLLSDVVGDRVTTPDRLREAARACPRLPRRRFVEAVLDDVAAGASSVLERRYLRRIERAHGLPRGVRQAPRPGGAGLQDVLYLDGACGVELDGGLNHHGWDAQGRDARRDLEDAAAGLHRVRLRWGQVEGAEACRTAALLACVLARHGWAGAPRPCGAGCVVGCVVGTAAGGQTAEKQTWRQASREGS
ncbi:hypothetical protein [Nocardioides sp. GY 10127]|uniref:hypothetical protein n=1 Tax=Nocardioides sp. GY 10127 TaxID=2569762 RepID=UPI0010A92957|nr:hypothetical protein [Nocardioides sp. GY 10127]TIC79438.1 hypothetical protein E8D37_17860 [Nocardioides sp. GY 10127]